MSDKKDGGFRITDRRKFNPDGSPRETSEESTVAADSSPQSVGDNIVSFPVDQSKAAAAGASASLQESASEPIAASASHEPLNDETDRPTERQRSAPASGPTDPAFVGLVNMLAMESELALGIAGPGEVSPEVNIEAARQLIDTIAMLQNKMRGNLNAQEENLLEEILAYLRMQFVQVSRGR